MGVGVYKKDAMITMRKEKSKREGLLDLIKDIPSGITMVEIGSFAGESVEIFMQSGKIKKLYAVDPWLSHKYDKDVLKHAEKLFDKVAKKYNVVKLKGVVDNFINKIPLVDMVYIDGDHRYEVVKNDILKMLPKIKADGIISGHDWVDRNVVKAVTEILGQPDVIYKDSSWLIYRH